MKYILALIILFTPMAAYSWSLFGTYEDCILENIGAGMSNSGVTAVKRACRKKFPHKKTQPIKHKDLPREVLNNLDGKAGVEWDGRLNKRVFKGTMFNNNKDWTIKSLTIRIYNKDTEEHRDYIASVSHYKTTTLADYGVSPLTNGFFSFDPYDLPKKHSWRMVGGKGYK